MANTFIDQANWFGSIKDKRGVSQLSQSVNYETTNLDIWSNLFHTLFHIRRPKLKIKKTKFDHGWLGVSQLPPINRLDT